MRKIASMFETKFFLGPPASSTRREMCSFMAELCWHALHFIVTIIVFVASVINKLWYLLFAKGSMQKYKALQGKKPHIMGVVIESQEAETEASKICDLLLWLSDVGVEHVSLYDMEGVLKQSRRVLEKILGKLNKGIRLINTWEEHRKQTSNSPSTEQTTMTVELLSFCDGKEGIAKAARCLWSDTLQKIDLNEKHMNLKLTEADIDRGLEATGWFLFPFAQFLVYLMMKHIIFTIHHMVTTYADFYTTGCAGPEPDLLFVFGFTQCLLGFPAWRLRFTEIIYVGMLKFLTLNSLLKALNEFSTKNQRYGT